MGKRRAVTRLLAVAMALALAGCRGGPPDGWSRKARTMVLTSGPTEIVISSSKAPGYWADQLGKEIFLYTRDRAFKKGNRVRVEGPYGGTYAAVFRDDGAYLQSCPLTVLVVWKMERSNDAESR